MSNQAQTQTPELDRVLAEMHDALSKPRGGLDSLAFSFCSTWPAVRPLLEALRNVPALGWAISVLLILGDAYQEQHCGAKQ